MANIRQRDGARRRRQGQTNDREPITSTGRAELLGPDSLGRTPKDRRKQVGSPNHECRSMHHFGFVLVRAVIHIQSPVQSRMYKCPVGTRLTNVPVGALERFVAKARSRISRPNPASPSTPPAGSRLPPAESFPPQYILQRCDAIPLRAPRVKSIACPPGTAMR